MPTLLTDSYTPPAAPPQDKWTEQESTARVLKAVDQKLRASSHRFPRHVRCDYAHGVLHMTGSLPNFYLKQLAQSLVERVEGVLRIENRIDVANPSGRSSLRSE